MQTSALKILFIALCIIAVIAIVAIIFAVSAKKKKAKPNQPEVMAGNNPPPHREEPVDEEMKFIAEGIKINADSFNGLYEGVFAVATNSANADSSVLAEWEIRIKNMQGNDAFKNIFLNSFNFRSDDLVSQADKLLRCISLAGIVRSVETEHIFALNSSKKYICLSGIVPEGTLCAVVKPYWHMNEKIIEQGCIIKKEG